MRYALVTGGSRGIGRAICIQLARDGYSVIINYKSNHEAANETLRLIESEGMQAELLPFDVVNPEEINAALDTWEQKHKDEYIEVLVNNVGIFQENLFFDVSNEDWNSMMDINLNSFYYVTRPILANMLMHHYGRIVNMSSIIAFNGHVGLVCYAASKAAIMGATKSLAKELASKKITVNAIAPGLIRTDFTMRHIEQNFESQDKAMNHIKDNIPMQRMGTPEEVADLVSFLVSAKAAYITGQVIAIDGGWGI